MKLTYIKEYIILNALLILSILASTFLAQEQKVLVIGIDGLLTKAVGPSNIPYLNSLYENGKGFLTNGYTENLTFSAPGWSTILHGDHHDYQVVSTDSYQDHNFSKHLNFLKRLKAYNPELYTAVFVTWSLRQENFKGTNGVENWLILLITDHGGEVRGLSGNLFRQRYIPIIVCRQSGNTNHAARNIQPRNVDVCKTVLGFMDIPEKEISGLGGHNLLILVLELKVDYGKNFIFNGNGEFD